MYHFLRHRRFGFILLVAAALLIFRSDIQSLGAGIWDRESSLLEDASLDDLFNSTEQLSLQYAREPYAHQHSIKWTDAEGIPNTRVLAHVPGFTVLRNVYSLNGTLFLVNERRQSLPNLKYILSAYAEISGGKTVVDVPTQAHIRVIDHKTAIRFFGLSARELRGSTWLCNDPIAYTDESFILGFLRTHYMQEHRAHFNKSILPPARVLFRQISNRIQNTIPGLSSIPRLLFPSSSTGFKEDWDDYASVNRAIVLETVVLLDRAAAARNPNLSPDAGHARTYLEVGSPLASFRLLNGKWWAIWRKRMGEMIGGVDITSWHGESVSSVKPVITYITRQDKLISWLYDDDHQQLVKELENLRILNGYEVNIVDPTKISFLERIRLALRTTIMIGPTGTGLSDVMWMHASLLSLLVEFFPENYLSSKCLYIAKSVGVEYLAWKGTGPFTTDELTPKRSSDTVEARSQVTEVDLLNKPLWKPIRVDSKSLCKFIVTRLERDQGEDIEDM